MGRSFLRIVSIPQRRKIKQKIKTSLAAFYSQTLNQPQKKVDLAMKEFVLISFLCFEENSEFQNRTLKRSILLRAHLHDRRTFRTKGKGAWRCVIVIVKNTGLAIHCFSFIVKFSFVINKRQVCGMQTFWSRYQILLLGLV